MRRIRLLIALSLFAVGALSADHPHERQCGTHPSSAALRVADGNGGIYLPSSGVLRILIVFASFPDDTTAACLLARTSGAAVHEQLHRSRYDHPLHRMHSI